MSKNLDIITKTIALITAIIGFIGIIMTVFFPSPQPKESIPTDATGVIEKPSPRTPRTNDNDNNSKVENPLTKDTYPPPKPSNREEAAGNTAEKSNPSAYASGKKELSEEKILGTWIFETQYNYLLYSNGARVLAKPFYKSAIRFTLEGNNLSGEHLWLETKDNNCGINDIELSGTIIGNKIDLVFEFLGDCCRGTKSQIEGELVSENKLIGKVKPLDLPTGSCANGWATFTAFRERN